jgi:predicted HicB family RNase H-like nuclease
LSEDTISYKNYSGSLEASAEDQCLYGRVLDIADLVTYEGQTQAQVRQAFREAVDCYLQKCAELGVEPDRPRPRRQTALGG